MEYGVCKGDKCNRDGCIGIIDEHEKEGCCHCHINPPCSYCVTDTSFCPICGWSCDDEDKSKPTEEQLQKWKEESDNIFQIRNLFYNKFSTGKGIEKLEMRIENHTHFSHKVVGVFPKGTESKKSLLDKVIGTFGGRWDRFNEWSFVFIAYTD